MEWAVGVSVASGRRIVIDVEDSSGNHEQLPPDELYRRGVPDVATGSRRRLKTRFEQWQRLSPAEYKTPFALAGLGTLPQTHHVFGFHSGKRQYLVPAVMLMRAAFRPARHVLPSMFLPQALDQMSHLNFAYSPPAVVAEMSWATPSARRRFQDWSVLLTWLHFHPCARRMAASVYQFALRGELGLVLPTGRASFTARGVDMGLVTVVTEMQLATVAPSTAPDVPGAECPGEYALHGQAARAHRPAVVSAARFQVPVRQDGSTDVSDAEWTEIEAALRAHQRVKRRGRHCQRQLLNDVLMTLATNRPWRSATCSSAGWWTVNYSFREWSQSGAMADVVDVLGRHRGSARI